MIWIEELKPLDVYLEVKKEREYRTDTIKTILNHNRELEAIDYENIIHESKECLLLIEEENKELDKAIERIGI